MKYKKIKYIAAKTFVTICFAMFIFSCEERNLTQKKGIISLVPSLTDFAQLIYPNEIIGVSKWCDAPLVKKSIPIVGDYSGLDYEKIIELNPSKIILLRGFTSNEQIKKLNEIGVKLQFFEDKTIADVLDISLKMDYKKGKKIKDSLETEFEKLKVEKTSSKPSYLIFISNDPIQVFGNGNYQTELLDSLGFKNSIEDINNPYPILDNEYFLTHLPNIIASSNSKQTKLFLERKFSKKAIEKVLFFEIKENILSRSGPTFLQVGKIFLNLWKTKNASRNKV